ncbi:SOS response-associated peptidase family protein [Hyphomonas oceanitis]|uniref:SOS response-associated peptidase family protein n=1 Tax=Hyphomonas TaxID=85 RepID=UPI0030036E37
MCGRFYSSLSWEEYRDTLDLKGEPPSTNFAPNWNTAPTHDVLICSEHDGERRIEQMKWGLVPVCMKEKPKFSTINAKCETVEEKPTWKGSPAAECERGAPDSLGQGGPRAVAFGAGR